MWYLSFYCLITLHISQRYLSILVVVICLINIKYIAIYPKPINLKLSSIVQCTFACVAARHQHKQMRFLSQKSKHSDQNSAHSNRPDESSLLEFVSRILTTSSGIARSSSTRLPCPPSAQPTRLDGSSKPREYKSFK